jgi:hypothetical protein
MRVTHALLLLCAAPLAGQAANYDEAKVPEYTLPDPLRGADGSRVTDAQAWRDKRRPEVLALFEDQMFGRSPGRPARLRFEVTERGAALAGKVTRKQIAIHCGAGDATVVLHLLLYLPAAPAAGERSRVPVFLGLNFNGNHAVQDDPAIALSRSWMRNRKGSGNKDNKATPAARGTAARRWPVAEVVARGAGLATMYYGDIDPDFDDGFRNGVHALFPVAGKARPADAWGSIAAWAWGLSRALDYLATDPGVDGERVVVVGHSRLGKTALWAGASDPRFAMVVSNDSGCGGAALSRRRFGETVARINKVFPHWFCGNFKAYGGREDALPFDQHMLIALAAPRPVLVCSAVEDRWADPRGEFLAAFHAGPVFRLFGHPVLTADAMPKVDALKIGRVGYFLRAGKHDMTLQDWRAYLDFAAHHGLLQPAARKGR